MKPQGADLDSEKNAKTLRQFAAVRTVQTPGLVLPCNLLIVKVPTHLPTTRLLIFVLS